MKTDVVYFELNNWFADRDFPASEPFMSWMKNDLKIQFRDEAWVKQNKLAVRWYFYDMSQNFLITAPRVWVESECPELLSKYKQFLRYPDSDDCVYAKNGDVEFLPYSEDNIGVQEVDEPYQ